MTRFLSFVLLLLTVPASARAAPATAGALPAGSRVLMSLNLGSGEEAVVFQSGATYVAVLAVEHGAQAETWHRRLPFSASRLFPTGTSGAFAGIGTRPGGTDGEFFAYRVAGGRVHGAIAGATNGLLTAGEGVHTAHGEVDLRVRDAAHQGSVAYSLVTHYDWQSTRYLPRATTFRPDYAPAQLPHPSGVIKTRHGDTILIRLEVASTEQERETGLMNRTSLDPDAGMVFVWDAPVLESFWMENTYVPLSVAFLAPDGTIQEIQDMQPLTTTLHTPLQPYQYAIEVNLGFFARYGIQTGDRVQLQLA